VAIGPSGSIQWRIARRGCARALAVLHDHLLGAVERDLRVAVVVRPDGCERAARESARCVASFCSESIWLSCQTPQHAFAAALSSSLTPDTSSRSWTESTTTPPHGAVAIGMSILYAFVSFDCVIAAGSGQSPPK
jgi:hypothetical protein